MVAVVAPLAALVAAPAAVAATLGTTRGCYQEAQPVVLRGDGFTPGSRVLVRLDGGPRGTTTADARGAIAARFDAGELSGARRERRHLLEATDGTNSAAAAFSVSKVLADFSPGRGDLATLRVRFRVSGFALRRARPTAYLHYVRPNGRARRTVRLGRADGRCGHIDRTARRRLFAFRAERGRWILQFDTNPRYRRATQRSGFVWVRKPVRVSARRPS